MCIRDSSLPKHGFCRTAEFALEDAGDTFVTYRLTDSDATRKGYPFAFCLRVRYTLEGDSVETRYTVDVYKRQTLYKGFRVFRAGTVSSVQMGNLFILADNIGVTSESGSRTQLTACLLYTSRCV